ncbi:MAG: hypothetical protein KGY80_06905 [Candidatus Thorarchaeota archaeon]|nr:hypothetical protein [Candidatus Thorarchaeota archaeon]
MKLTKRISHDLISNRYSGYHNPIASSVRLWPRNRVRETAIVFVMLFTVIVSPILLTSGLLKPFPQSKNPIAIVSAEPPQLNLTYYSLWNETQQPIVDDGDMLIGDHIMINATWSPVTNITRTALEIRAPAIPTVIYAESNSSSIEVNTRRLGNNATCIINATAWWGDGYLIRKFYYDVFIGNFFVPHIELEQPNGGEVWAGTNNVTWIASDNNLEENLTFEVLLSADGGKTYQLLGAGLNRTWFEWNCTGFLNLTTYKIQVRATDGIYIVSDQSDSTFTAGDIYTPPSTTTTTTTTTETTTTTALPTLSPRIGAMIAVIIVASAFLAVGVYYVAKTRI